MRATSGGFRQRPRAVWAALATGVVLSFILVLAVLLPVLGLIAAADAGTAGFLDVPAGDITLSILISYVLALVLLVLTFLSRNGALAWVLAVAAIIATLVGSIWPLFATAFASVEQGQQILPFIADLIGRATGN